ncbi:MAG: DNA-processing protein DprA [Candidatus Dojkabacteria bacterium]|jgi:DNA processing protein
MSKLSYKQIPPLLREIPSCPSQLYFKGDERILNDRCITIVGTRSITEYGRWAIEYLLDKFLKDLNISVVSGLARGVDACVHKLCLERDINTVAILPGSITSYIPKENNKLFEMIQQKGLVLAEFKRGIEFNRRMFVLRNRLLAGISEVTLVIEAGLKSGSLITAGLALEYNRDVYVIPGDLRNKMSQGCNVLAKQGAGVITSLDDFKEIFGIYNEQTKMNV